MLVAMSDVFDGELAPLCMHFAPEAFGAAVMNISYYDDPFKWKEPSSPIHTIPTDDILPPVLVLGTYEGKLITLFHDAGWTQTSGS